MSEENKGSDKLRGFPFLCVAGGVTVVQPTVRQEPPVQEFSTAMTVLNEEILILSHQNTQLGQELDRSRKLIREQAELITDLRARNQKLQTAVDAAKSLLDAWYSESEDREIRILNALEECGDKITKQFRES